MRGGVLGGLVLVLAVVALVSCSDGEEGSEIEGFVTINAVTAPVYHATLQLSGDRWTSVHTVNWRSDSGAFGSATLTVRHNCVLWPLPIVVAECNHGWTASIPLVVGANSIRVVGAGNDGDWGQATISITRLACPPQFVPEACS